MGEQGNGLLTIYLEIPFRDHLSFIDGRKFSTCFLSSSVRLSMFSFQNFAASCGSLSHFRVSVMLSSIFDFRVPPRLRYFFANFGERVSSMPAASFSDAGKPSREAQCFGTQYADP